MCIRDRYEEDLSKAKTTLDFLTHYMPKKSGIKALEDDKEYVTIDELDKKVEDVYKRQTDQIILKKATVFIVLKRLLYSLLEVYMAALWEIAAIIPAVIRLINKLYIGITSPYSPIPSGPINLDKYMENINPKIPVVIFASVKKNEFLKKLSFSN